MSSEKKLFLSLLLGLALLFGVLLHLTWLKWGDPVIDTGRELEIPWKVAEGGLLYRDMAYNYGPFSPYVNALFLKLFGTHILSIVYSGILAAAAGMVLVYLTSRIFLDRIASACLCGVFLFECAFQHYYPNNNFNFILPYSFPAVHGILAALGAFILLARYMDRESRLPLAGAGVLSGIALLCKVEIAGAVLATLAVAPLLMRRGRTAFFKDTASWGAPFAAVAIVGFAPFIAAASFQQVVWENVFKPQLVDISASIFFLERLGLTGLEDNLAGMIKSLGLWALFTAALGMGASLLPRLWYVAGILGLGAVAAAWFLLPYDLEFRCLPLVGIGVAAVHAYLAIKRKEERADACRILALSLFSLLCLLRIFLMAGTEHYGFCLALPGVILFAVFLLRVLPRWIPILARNPRFYGAAVLVALLALSARSFFIDSWRMYEAKHIQIEGPNGRMRINSTPLFIDFKDTLDHLKEKGKKGDTLLVLPEGALLNFLSGQPNPTYYNLFIPPELNAPGVEEDVIDRIEEAKVERIVVLNRPVLEYGFRGLGSERGKDYGVDLMTYIHEHYEKEQSYETPSVGYLPPGGSVIYRRKDASSE